MPKEREDALGEQCEVSVIAGVFSSLLQCDQLGH